jgi:hypothetical protein
MLHMQPDSRIAAAARIAISSNFNQSPVNRKKRDRLAGFSASGPFFGCAEKLEGGGLMAISRFSYPTT